MFTPGLPAPPLQPSTHARQSADLSSNPVHFPLTLVQCCTLRQLLGSSHCPTPTARTRRLVNAPMHSTSGEPNCVRGDTRAPEAECRSSLPASRHGTYTRTCPVSGQYTRHRSGTGSTRTHRSQPGAGTPQAAEDRKASGIRRKRRSRCSPPRRDSWPGTVPRARHRCSIHSGARARGCEHAGRLIRAIPCPKHSQPWRAVVSPAAADVRIRQGRRA